MARAQPRLPILKLTGKVPMPLSQQLRKARDLLAWSVDRTSEEAGLPATVIARAEMGEGAPDITLPELAQLWMAFETAGIRIYFDGTVSLDRDKMSTPD